MIQIITNENITEYIGYMTCIDVRNATYLGFRYGEMPVGACMIQEKGLSMKVDGLYIEPEYREQIIEELLPYLAGYADDNSVIRIEMMIDDEDLKNAFESYGITCETSAISYECSIKELLYKERVQKLLSIGSKKANDVRLINFKEFGDRKVPEKFRWIMNEADIWKEASYLLMKEDKIYAFCGVEKSRDSQGTDNVRLTYLYAKGSKYLPSVVNASMKKVLGGTKGDAKITFSSINKESLLLAKGLGFEEREIRSVCYKGTVLTMELNDLIYLRERVL